MMSSVKFIKIAIYLGIVLFFVVIIAEVYNFLSFLVFDIFRIIIFSISIWYFFWHYRITKSHVPSYERVAEGAIICAVIFNPILVFNLDTAVWIFLEAVFMWIFVIFIASIRKIEKNLNAGNIHWIDME